MKDKTSTTTETANDGNVPVMRRRSRSALSADQVVKWLKENKGYVVKYLTSVDLINEDCDSIGTHISYTVIRHLIDKGHLKLSSRGEDYWTEYYKLSAVA